MTAYRFSKNAWLSVALVVALIAALLATVPLPASALHAGDVVINEIHADPASGSAGDANGDGVRDFSDDEFVEIYNSSGSPLDISGWTLSDEVGVRHTFPASTTIPTDCAIVVFGGSTPAGLFGGAVVQTASTGALVLNNSGDTVFLNDGSDDVAETYGSEGGNNESLTRDPDITGSFVGHTSATDADGALFSPGSMIDGSMFAGCPSLLGAAGSADPQLTKNGENVLLTVEVFPATVPDSSGITVEGDLSAIGGSASQAFADVGANMFTFVAPVAAAPGDYALPITVEDAQTRMAETTIFLSVVNVLTIMEIQGTGQDSPFDGDLVETSGIVTAITSNGRDAWIQDPDGDGSTATSDGIAVDDFDSFDPTPVIGDLITIRGEAEESQFFPDLPKTRIDDTVLVSIDSSGNALPVPIALVDLPDSSILDGIDFWERLEGMRVSVDGGTVVAPTTRFGEFGLLTKKDAKAGSGYQTSVKQMLLNNTGPNQVDYNPERILVDDSTMGATNVRPGDKVGVTGVVDYSFGMYKIQPTEMDVNAKPIPSGPAASRSGGKGNTSITSYNVENLFDLELNPAKDDASSTPTFADLEVQLTKLRDSIIDELQLPEIMVLQEVENTEIAQELGDRVNAVAGTSYVAVSEETSDGRGIEVAFLYDENRVTLSDSFQLSGADVEAAFGPGSASPGREPLYGKFEIGDEAVHIVGNHFKSKGGDTPPFGAVQPFVRITEVQRKLQAQVVRDFVDGLLTTYGDDALVMVTGDLNDFEFGEPGEGTNHTVAILENGTVPLTNVVLMEKQSERFSFIFDGNSQVLDHMLLSPELLDRLEGTDFLHFNASYPAAIGADITTALRASDHDPLEGRFTFEGADKAKPKPDKNISHLQVLTVSDWHAQLDPLFVFGEGTFGGAAELSAYFDIERANNPNTLTLTAGDAYGAAPPLSNFFDEEPAVRAMRMMGFDYDTFGNHNFDRGIDHLQQMIDIADAGGVEPGEPFQYLSANLENRDDNLSGVKDFEIVTMDGVRVAVIGVTNPEAPTLVFPGRFGTIEVTDPAAAADDARAAAAKKGATVFVLLAHMGATGGDSDNPTGPLVDLANAVSGFDLIVGDHTDFLVGKEINGALVVENRSRGRTYARIDLTIEKGKDGGVISSSMQFVEPVSSDVVPDQAILDMLDPLRAELDVLLSVVIGDSTVEIPRSDECGQSSGRTCESLVGDVVTDAMRTTYATDFAIMNSGGLRAPLTCPTTDIPGDFCNPGDEGKITAGQVLTVLPFGNSVVTLSVTGAELKEHLERGVSAMPGVSGRFAQISGLCFTYDIELAVGSRVTGAVLQAPDGTCSGAAVDLTAGTTYTLAENDFMASGGDGYPNDIGSATTRELLDQVAAAYVTAFTPISPAIQGRITCTDSVGPNDCPVALP